jgi:TolA-binding protein
VLSLASGSHQIEAKLEGYSPYEMTIDVKAKTVISHAIAMKAVSLEGFYKAMALEAKKDWISAVAAYNGIIKAYPTTTIANQSAYRKGHIEMNHFKDYEAALKTFTDLVNEYPNTMIRAEGYYGLMRLNETTGNTQKALELRNYILNHYGKTSAADNIRKLQ